MDSKHDIAIVIPAYKSDFFEETFQSVISQTDSNFHIYIGNDAGDKKIEEIIYSSGSFHHLTYKYFDNNLGYESLTAHWNRCLDMVKDENWIWLFSDDDVMDPDCIENFSKTQPQYPQVSVFRFNTVKFKDDILLKENIFPEKVSLNEFLNIKFGYQSESYAVEYIFKKSLLAKNRGFTAFPLGWCSDDFFWIQCLAESDVVTISGSDVYWRYSRQNISGRSNNHDTAAKKMSACCLFIEKLKELHLFRGDDHNQELFSGWIFSQYQYLSPHLTEEQREYYLERIFRILPPQ